jgi:HSP20 family protein
MSFLDKLKVKVEAENAEKDAGQTERKNTGFLQLSVDIYQTREDIIIVAPIPGVEVKDIDISIENENDVVTIQGQREIPRILKDMEGYDEEDGKYLRQECQWGQFYRQIILPQEVNVAEVEAKFTKGILILKLPLLRLQNPGKKKIMVEN